MFARKMSRDDDDRVNSNEARMPKIATSVAILTADVGRWRQQQFHARAVIAAATYDFLFAFSALTLLAGRQEEHPACKS